MTNKVRLTRFHPSNKGGNEEKIKALEEYVEILHGELEYLLTQLSRGE